MNPTNAGRGKTFFNSAYMMAYCYSKVNISAGRGREGREVYTRGMLRLIFWLFVLLLALSFFGISLQAIINSPAGQANFNYVLNLLSQVWQWSTQWIRP